VTVEFSGTLSPSPSFADELYAKLDPSLIEHGRVIFENVSPSLAAIARSAGVRVSSPVQPVGG
jgi:hypothetical protein